MEGVDSALLAAIKRNPHKYYINVHTTEFTNGAVRGQLFGKRN
ncbi:MAG TPA: CHRD domain-containing protein [Thermoleophilaceae bacterium]|nr:CHRD domain-containing protein [Thermoleophilaceae bacterium]